MSLHKEEVQQLATERDSLHREFEGGVGIYVFND